MYVSFPTGCCGQSQQVWVQSPTQTFGPIYQGNVITRNFTLAAANPPNQAQCGNLLGVITDYLTQAGVATATVQLSPGSENTNGNGNYEFACPSVAYYRLPATLSGYSYQVSKTNYYNRSNEGSLSLTFPYLNNKPRAVITANSVQTLNSTLLSRGTGTITVIVKDINGNPVNSATVTFYQYSGSTMTSQYNTGADNVHTWTAVESWPPQGITLDPNEFQVNVVKMHKIVVSKTGYNEAAVVNIELQRGTTQTITVILSPTGNGI